MKKQQPLLPSHPRVVAKLLGLICVFEQTIETIKQELAGHPEFDTRPGFSSIDRQHKGHIDLQNLKQLLGRLGPSFTGLMLLPTSYLQGFLRRYGRHSRMTYQQFLTLMLPRNNASLAQSLMVRNSVSRVLPEYLQKKLESLLALYLILTIETEELKQGLSESLSFSLLDQHHRLHTHINTEQGLHSFITQNGNVIDRSVVRYLVNHTSNKTPLRDFGELQYREIFSPISSLKSDYFDVALDETLAGDVSRRSVAKTRIVLNQTLPEERDNYLSIRFNSSRRGIFTNRTSEQNQNTNINYQPLNRNIGHPSILSLNEMSKQKHLDYSPIPRNTIRNFEEEEVNLPTLDMFMTERKHNRNLSNTLLVPSDRQQAPPLQLPPPQLPPPQTLLIDKFMATSVIGSPFKAMINNGTRKEVFEDNLDDSQNSAFKSY